MENGAIFVKNKSGSKHKTAQTFTSLQVWTEQCWEAAHLHKLQLTSPADQTSKDSPTCTSAVSRNPLLHVMCKSSFGQTLQYQLQIILQVSLGSGENAFLK